MNEDAEACELNQMGLHAAPHEAGVVMRRSTSSGNFTSGSARSWRALISGTMRQILRRSC